MFTHTHTHKQLAAQQPADDRKSKAKLPCSRDRALEFAKTSVPKPRVKAAAPSEAPGDAQDEGEGGEEEEEELTPLQLLALRHERDKQLVHQIRRDLRV